jgi:hypothetical protein
MLPMLFSNVVEVVFECCEILRHVARNMTCVATIFLLQYFLRPTVFRCF